MQTTITKKAIELNLNSNDIDICYNQKDGWSVVCKNNNKLKEVIKLNEYIKNLQQYEY